MQQINVSEGQTLRITGTNITIEVVSTAARGRRGPRSLPKANISSRELHKPILKMLKSGPLSGEQIRAALLPKVPGATTNTASWALVELQNEGSLRGKNREKTGPVVKIDDGLYALRP